MRYKILLNKKIKRFIETIEKEDRERLRSKMMSLSNNPLPKGTKKVRGKYDNLYRVRVGKLSILYLIDDNFKEVMIVKIDKRSKVY